MQSKRPRDKVAVCSLLSTEQPEAQPRPATTSCHVSSSPPLSSSQKCMITLIIGFCGQTSPPL